MTQFHCVWVRDGKLSGNEGVFVSDGAGRVKYAVSAFKKARSVDGGRLMLLAPRGDHAHALEAFRETVASLVDEWNEPEADDLWIVADARKLSTFDARKVSRSSVCRVLGSC